MTWSENVRPMLRLMTRRKDAGRMLDALCESVERQDEDGNMLGYGGIDLWPIRWQDDWVEVLVYLKATTVFSRNLALRAFERFAAALIQRMAAP